MRATIPGRRGGTSASVAQQVEEEDDQQQAGHKPWLLHALSVNALNFCAFAVCDAPDTVTTTAAASCENDDSSQLEKKPPSAVLIAAPNGLDSGGIDVFALPSERRVSQIKSDTNANAKANAGMVMALGLAHAQAVGLVLTAGYEDGSVGVFYSAAATTATTAGTWTWQRRLTCRVHSQPVLSLCISPDRATFFTSSADALVARFDLAALLSTGSGSGSGSIEAGGGEHDDNDGAKADKVHDTKHAGQQDVKVRSDGRILATAGWDGSVRVYSARSLKELAVLQWHREGCYAVAFAEVLGQGATGATGATGEQSVAVGMNRMERMKEERDRRVHATHWLVSGSKDGKIALWEIY